MPLLVLLHLNIVAFYHNCEDIQHKFRNKVTSNNTWTSITHLQSPSFMSVTLTTLPTKALMNTNLSSFCLRLLFLPYTIFSRIAIYTFSLLSLLLLVLLQDFKIIRIKMFDQNTSRNINWLNFPCSSVKLVFLMKIYFILAGLWY